MSTARGDDAPPSLDGLAGRLRALREATRPRISQTDAARAIDASQNKISRAETGLWLLTPQQVMTLARLYGADPAEARRLRDWTEALAPNVVDSRMILQRSTSKFQQRIMRAEEASKVVRSYQPAIALGVLQSEAYAGVIFDGDAKSVAARLERNRLMLDNPERRWLLIQTEGSLMWNLGGADIMAAQLDSMIDASRRPNVDLRIVSRDRPASFFALHGFHIYDEQAVMVGTLTATSLTSNRQDVDRYLALFDRLADLAVSGDDARAVLARLAGEYRVDAGLIAR